MSTSKSFVLYSHYLKHLQLLNMEQRGRLITALFEYHATREAPKLEDSLVELAFSFISEQMDYDLSEYEKRCEHNKRNASRRWGSDPTNGEIDGMRGDANACDRIFEDAKVCDRMRGDANRCLSNSNSNSDSNSNSNSNSNSDSVSEKENNTDGSSVSPSPKKRKKKSSSDSLHKAVEKKPYGRYKNVLLSDAEHAELSAEFPDLAERIERLSEYMESRGIGYSNHAATIVCWSRRNFDRGTDGKKPKPSQPENSSFDTDEFFNASLKRAQRYLMGESRTP